MSVSLKPSSPQIGIPETILPFLSPTYSKDGRSIPIVIMTCGISGSGKSTFAREICSRYPSFTRLSIDGYIWEHHGMYGIDYPGSKYSQYQDEEILKLDEKFVKLLREGSNLVLDYSFSRKADRDEIKETVEKEGGRWVLVYFSASEDKDLLKERIAKRKSRRLEIGVNGDSAFEVTEEVLESFCSGFEFPNEEGERTV